MDFYVQKFPHLEVAVKNGHQLWISLNNPDQMNAISISISMIDSLLAVLKYADFDKNIRVIVLTGAGGSFCAGGDIKAMEEKSGMFQGDSFEFGLLNNLFEDSILVSETEKLADKIAGLAPIAQSMTKKAMKISYLNDLSTSLDLLAAFQGITQRTNDHFHALNSFKKKQKPNFSGE